MVTAALLDACLAPPAAAAILEVPGSFATIQSAIDAAGAGDTVEVASGTYAEKLVFTNGGNAIDGFLTVTAAPGAPTRPVLDGTGVAGANMVLIDDKSFVRLAGFEIVNNLAVNDGSGVRIRGSGTDIEILDNVIHEIRGQHAMGITVYGTEADPIENLVIDGNEIYDCDPAQSEALTLNGNVTGFAVTNNVVRDVDNIAIDCIGGETDIQPDQSLVCRNGVIRANTVARARSSYGGGYAGGIYVDGGRDVTIENNRVTECDLGIEIGAENAGLVTSNVTVRNNAIYLNDKAGLVFGGFKASVGRANDNVFRGNTLYRNNTLGRDQGGEGEIWIQYAENNTIENNIVYADADNVFVVSFAGSVGNSFDYNLYHSAAGAGEFSLNGAEFAGLAAWQAGTANDASSLAGDPGLADPEAGDVRIDAASPAFDAGNPAYAPEVGETDLDGSVRLSGAAVDIGADEASCGDGTTDPGEQCDDGNTTSGDGCDVNCTFTACGNGVSTPASGEACDDGNLVAGDCCDGGCQHEAPGSPCDDGRACTVEDLCDGAGTCVGGTDPDANCQAPSAPRGSSVKLLDKDGGRDRLAWKWGRSTEVPAAVLGDPTDGDDYFLCVYVEETGSSALQLEAALPAGAAWEDRGGSSTRGFRYRESSALPDGVQKASLRPGPDGKAKIKISGKGSALALASPEVAPSAVVTVQLRGPAPQCFTASYSAPFKKNLTSQFKDTSD